MKNLKKKLLPLENMIRFVRSDDPTWTAIHECSDRRKKYNPYNDITRMDCDPSVRRRQSIRSVEIFPP